MYRFTPASGLSGMISKIFLAAPLCIMGVASAATPASALTLTGDVIKFEYFYTLTAHKSDSKMGIGSFIIGENPKPGTYYTDSVASEIEPLGPDDHATYSNHRWKATWVYDPKVNANPRVVQWSVKGLLELYPGINLTGPDRNVSARSSFGQITAGGVFKDVTVSGTETFPESVPGPLPILGAAAAFGFSRKLRKRLRSSKSEVISTTAL